MWCVCRKPSRPTRCLPVDALREAGYASAFSGQKTYNGVAILSRLPMTEVQAGIPGFADEQKRVLAATIDGVRIVCVYIPNGQSLDSDKYQYKMAWLDALIAWLKDEMHRHPRLALLGDYNIAPEDCDCHDPAAWVGQVLVSEPERARFQALRDLGLQRCLPPVRTSREELQLVGLPHDGFPPQSRHAHRPYPALAGAGTALQRMRDRQGATQAGTSVGSHACAGDAVVRQAVNSWVQ
jgi:hypothetical protein